MRQRTLPLNPYNPSDSEAAASDRPMPQPDRPCAHAPHPHERRGGARLAVYFLLCVLCNFLLAVCGLYAFGLCAQLSQDTRVAGATLAELTFQILLLLSPILLAILLNRLLYCGMRGRRCRFPRWTVPIAFLVILSVQTLTLLLVLTVFRTGGASGFNVDTISSLLP